MLRMGPGDEWVGRWAQMGDTGRKPRPPRSPRPPGVGGTSMEPRSLRCVPQTRGQGPEGGGTEGRKRRGTEPRPAWAGLREAPSAPPVQVTPWRPPPCALILSEAAAILSAT